MHITGAHSAPLDQLVRNIRDVGGLALAIVGDVAEKRTHQEAVAAALSTFGGLHIGFNNAGLVGAIKPRRIWSSESGKRC